MRLFALFTKESSAWFGCTIDLILIWLVLFPRLFVFSWRFLFRWLGFGSLLVGVGAVLSFTTILSYYDTVVRAEPHSKRLKVRVTVRKEVLNKVMLQQEATVEVRTWGVVSYLVAVRQNSGLARTYVLINGNISVRFGCFLTRGCSSIVKLSLLRSSIREEVHSHTAERKREREGCLLLLCGSRLSVDNFGKPCGWQTLRCISCGRILFPQSLDCCQSRRKASAVNDATTVLVGTSFHPANYNVQQWCLAGYRFALTTAAEHFFEFFFLFFLQFVVHNKQCNVCNKEFTNQTWKAVVQVSRYDIIYQLSYTIRYDVMVVQVSRYDRYHVRSGIYCTKHDGIAGEEI